jgi:hypothetical protein
MQRALFFYSAGLLCSLCARKEEKRPSSSPTPTPLRSGAVTGIVALGVVRRRGKGVEGEKATFK